MLLQVDSSYRSASAHHSGPNVCQARWLYGLVRHRLLMLPVNSLVDNCTYYGVTGGCHWVDRGMMPDASYLRWTVPPSSARGEKVWLGDLSGWSRIEAHGAPLTNGWIVIARNRELDMPNCRTFQFLSHQSLNHFYRKYLQVAIPYILQNYF